MRPRLEEIDWQETPLGPITLRRRLEPKLKVDVYEVRLGDEYLMSSLFTVAETQLAHLALPEAAGKELDVLVGGLGLGYTAVAALQEPRVRTLTVVEALAPVISWHENRLLPDTTGLTADSRTRLVLGDFFGLVRDRRGFGPGTPERYHGVLLDIDHTPGHLLHPSHADFYTVEGLRTLARHLHPGGVFAMWSDDPPDPHFLGILEEAFSSVTSHVVGFPNPLTGGSSASTVYVSQGA